MKSCSYNEWDPLLEVVVGNVIGAEKMAYEPSLGAYFDQEPDARSFSGGHWEEDEIAEAQKQLDGLASILVERGIVVRRPEPFQGNSTITTPDFVASHPNSFACPRDVLFVVGDLIVEAPMAQRGRFFEYRGYRQIMLRHFSSGGRWLACPKPFLRDRDFAPDYTTTEQPFHPENHPVLLTDDPCFDAASFTRCGRDIFWQPDMVSNAAGAQWLRQAIGTEYRIHRVEFDDRYPQHIDTTLVPLRPKLAMINPERPPRGDTLHIFERNGWVLIKPPPSIRAGLPAPARDVSNWISMNVLVLDPQTVIVEEAEYPLANFLEGYGFRAIRVPFDKVYKFGGGFHCCTVDLRRDGDLDSYFSE